MKHTIHLFFGLILSFMLAACGGGGGGGTTPASTITAPAKTSATLASIDITPATANVSKGLSANFTAIGTYSDGSTADVTSVVTWSSGNSNVATIGSATGVATGVAVGSTTVIASANGITSPTASLTVTAATITSISITPTAPSTPKGRPVTFSATGTYSDGTTGNVSGSVTWISSNTAIASLNGSGIASSLGQGTTTVTAVANGVTSNAVTLTVTAPLLTAIAINPINTTVAAGLTTNFTATGTYTDGSTANITDQVSWASANTGIATIVSTSGAATGVAVGNTTVTASLSGITSTTAALTVNTAVLTGISITPTAPSTPKGLPVTFTATGTYSNGTTGNVSGSVVWASSDTAVATLNASGVASSLGQGSTTVTAALSGIVSSNATLTVTAPALTAIAITPTTSSVSTGSTTSFTATGTYTDASTANITSSVAWTSANSAFATISAAGVATGVAVGSTTVSASSGGITSNSASLTIAPALTSIAITPATTSVAKGLPATFTATGTYSNGTTGNVTTSVTWSSSNTTAATINASGTATTLAEGSSSITATLNGLTSNTATLTVTAPALTSIVINSNGSWSLGVGDTLGYTPTGTYTDGTQASLIGSSSVTWNSSNTAVVSVNSTVSSVTAYALTPGSANISASSGGVTSNTSNISVLTTYSTPPGVVTTLAGSGTAGFADGTGTAALFNGPCGIATDGTSLYVADSTSHVIRKIVIAAGTVTTLAGTGYPGAADGTGVNASFYQPCGIATDGTSLYVGDVANNKIRKIVIATGVVTTLAGSGAAGYADGTGTAASFKTPNGMAVVGANLYVADAYNYRIRKIVIGTGVVTTLAGSGTPGIAGSVDGTGTAASFFPPGHIATDGINLYVTEGHKIRKIVIATGAVTTLAGSSAVYGSADGTGIAANFMYSLGIATDGANLFVTDKYKVRKIVIATGVVTTLAGSGYAGAVNGTGSAASFNYLYGITNVGSTLYLADYMNHLIRKIQ